MSDLPSPGKTAHRRSISPPAQTGVGEIAVDTGLSQVEQAEEAVRSASWLNRTCRATLHKAFAKIDSGHVLIEDPIDQVSFGHTDHVDLRALVHIKDVDVYRKMILGGTLAAAEAYLDGHWTTNDLTSLLRIMARNLEQLQEINRKSAFWLGPYRRFSRWMRRNSKSGSQRNIAAHYDLSNDFFQLMLDRTMMYSSGIFEHDEATLEEASIAKIERICRKCDLDSSKHVLEIGTGWGGFAIHAAKTYGCHVTTTTISREQYRFAEQRIKEAGLEDRITLLLADYRDLRGQYDHVVSIEMIEAVGRKYLDTYFQACSQLLKPSGTMVLQAITIPDERIDAYSNEVDFIQKYVFPGGFLPSYHLITRSLYRKTDLRLIHAEDFGMHYARTLAMWRENFHANIAKIRVLGMDDTFRRLWDYYLSYCEAGFLERQIGVGQLVLSKPKYRGSSMLESLATP